MKGALQICASKWLTGDVGRTVYNAMNAKRKQPRAHSAARKSNKASFSLRAPKSGDMGWVVQRHGEIYAKEFGWDWEFEGLVAEIVAKFVRDFNPKRERCWIAEKSGKRVGCIFLVEPSPDCVCYSSRTRLAVAE